MVFPMRCNLKPVDPIRCTVCFQGVGDYKKSNLSIIKIPHAAPLVLHPPIWCHCKTEEYEDELLTDGDVYRQGSSLNLKDAPQRPSGIRTAPPIFEVFVTLQDDVGDLF